MASRQGIGKSILVGVVIVVIAAAGLAALYMGGGLGASSTSSSSSTSSASSHSSSSTSSTPPSTSGSGPGIAIQAIDGNVQGPGTGYLSSNDTTINNDSIYIGNTSSTLVVQFDIVYANCPATGCPTHVTQVTVFTPGFTVLSTKPATPIPVNNPPGASAGQVEFHFTVNVKAPATQYNGPLLLVATVQ